MFLTFVSETAGGMAAKPTAARAAITAPARTNRAGNTKASDGGERGNSVKPNPSCFKVMVMHCKSIQSCKQNISMYPWGIH